MAKTNNPRPNRALEEQGKIELEGRPVRETVSEDADIMTAYGISEDKHPRWVLDIRNRIPKMAKLGYEFVYRNDVRVGEGQNFNYGRDIGSAVCESAGWDSREGKPLKQYLMVIDRELYESNQADKEARNKEIQNSMTDVAKSQFSGSSEGRGHVASPYGKIA